MSIIFERSNHGLTLYKTSPIPELHEEMLSWAQQNDPEPEEELSF